MATAATPPPATAANSASNSSIFSWDPQKRSGQYTLERTRHHAQDKRVYRFEYTDQDWAKNLQMRQLIVRATNPRSRTVEVGVLTDDRERAAGQIIHLIFNRWTQENDFKYLDEHFGINQITSGASVACEKLKGQVEQKEMPQKEMHPQHDVRWQFNCQRAAGKAGWRA